ncbi:MAG: response regulator [Gemmatimonadales bacterium]
MTKRILVVDDDRGMVETLCDILELHGWSTIRAFDGEDAVRLAREETVDVVLMDVRMPRLNGVEALQAIKKDRPGARVVLMTAFAAQELIAEAESAGVLQVLRKPVELTSLLAFLETARGDARSVLVVDDQPEFLNTLCDLLTSQGLAPVKARTLNEAVARMASDKPTAVLLDLRLNHVDPKTCILAIREVNPAVLLVLYSGHPDDLHRTVEETPAGLIDAAFTKPLPIDRLLNVLNDR